MHLLIKARSGGLIVKTDGKYCTMQLTGPEDDRGLPLCGESMRRGMLSYILGEVRRVHAAHDQPPLFEDLMREGMLARMRVRIVKEPFCHTIFGQYASKVLPSKIRIDDYGWTYANTLIAHLRPALVKVTGKESLGEVNAALQDALAVSGAKQRRFFVAMKKKTEGKALREADVAALRYKDEIEQAIPKLALFDRGVKIESKFVAYYEEAVDFIAKGFTGKKISVSEMHFQLLAEIHSLCQDADWRRRLHDVNSTKFSIIPFPQHTAQWINIPQDNILFVRGAPLLFATCDFDLLIEDLTEQETARVLAGPMSCFYAKWGTGYVSLESDLPLEGFDDTFPVLSQGALKSAGVFFLKEEAEAEGAIVG